MKRLMLIVVGVLVVTRAFSEYRIWESTSGDIWEAEFITLTGANVLLKEQSGAETTHPVAELSKNDQDYLDEILPPKLSIDISKTTSNSGSKNKTKIKCHAVIKQADTRNYDNEMVLVLVVLAEDVRTKSVSVANRTEEKFTLPEEWGNAFEMESKAASLHKANVKSGRKYGGYIAVVWDRFGNPVAIKTNRPAMEEKAARLAYVSLKNRNRL